MQNEMQTISFYLLIYKDFYSLSFLGDPQGKDGNQKIRDKCKQYLDRAEVLQEYLEKKQVVALTQYFSTYNTLLLHIFTVIFLSENKIYFCYLLLITMIVHVIILFMSINQTPNYAFLILL